ncbi:Na(+)/H(+) exchange regulatory cofactor NHE-RF3 [Amia ocellicauda]|uniref:Na(+)/H(+) exchange regulatory cofactor NHE-RF3 n=1 Tax=Amia ocellicauda TaxID=2972642 RepID=UPI0034641E53
MKLQILIQNPYVMVKLQGSAIHITSEGGQVSTFFGLYLQGDEMASFQPTVIKLSKQEGQSYGFFLRVEMGTEGHLIRCIEKGGLAELAGLKDGDRVLRVNGVFVDDQEHARVVQLVKESGQSVTFHMLDEATYEKAKKSGINLSGVDESRPAQPPLMNGVAGSALKPKLCYLVNVKEGFGFSLKSTKGYQGMFFTDVKPSGAAAKAGVRNNDRLIEINGENVEKSTHDQIVAKVKASGKSVTFLVVDEETNTHFRNKNLKLGASLATVKHLPHKPRIAEMTRGPEGYGYYLRAEKKRPGHFIKDIDAGSPAEKAGLKDMDRLVAVNGEAVDSLVHDKVVEKIRECGNKCTLLIVDEETDNIYRMAGASPLLFWEEMKDCFDSAPEKVRPTHQQEAQQSSAVPVQLPSPTPPPPSEEQKDYKPKLCKLRKTTGGFGFHLNAIQGIQGQFVKEVLKGGPADEAGLKDNDILIEVNGVNIENCSHDDVVGMIKSSGNSLVMLVVEKEAYDYFKAKQIPITTLLLGMSLREVTPTPPKPAEPQKEEKEEEEKQEEEKEEKQEEEEEEKEKEEEEEEDEPARPATPPETRDRSDSSSSSSTDEDERF